ncbi:MAG: cysteine--tRNA ligase [Alphaproteobacteria bacterium]
MKISILDTLSGKKREFVPIDPNNVRVYACGPTVYDFPHVGNARMAVATDLLIRVLKKNFDKVLFVSNVTDVDDKIIKSAKEKHIPIEALTNKFLEIYNQNMNHLNVKKPDLQPKATECIQDMINMIQKLLNNKCAYKANKHILFAVETYKYYGKLSGRSIDEQVAGARVEIADFKKNPRDFVLWKPSNDDEPGWASPWGRGRPGWHIECSAMSHKCLDTPFDIHCGGVDLTFPHHENEIAQSCSTLEIDSDPENFCRYWFHNGFVTYKGEKMSKSIGNIQLVDDILKKYDGTVIRLSLMSAHYRQPLNWTEEILIQSEKNLIRIYKNINKIKPKRTKNEFDNHDLFKEFQESLFDDLNTPKALGVLNKILNQFNKSINDEKENLYYDMIEALDLLGLNQEIKELKKIDEDVIKKLIVDRDKARKEKDFKRADEIREKLNKLNVEIEDTAEGTKWVKQK